MAEAAGLAATCAGLLGALSGLIKFSKKIHDAPKDWGRYCALLDNLCQLCSTIRALTNNMDGLSKVIVTHNGRDYGLIEFCVNNAKTALGDATMLLSEFEQLKGNVKPLDRVKAWLRNKSKQLLWVLQEQDIQGCIQRVETAMVGLSIAIHAASLVRTSHGEKLTRLAILSYNENKKAIDDLTKQLAENFEKLEKCHEKSLGKQERRTIHLIVRPLPRRYQLSRTISSVPGKRTRRSQTVQASATEASPHLAVAHDQSQIDDVLSDLEQDHMVAGAASRDPSGDQLGYAPVMSLDTLSHNSPFLDVGCELPSLTDQADDIEITCEDGSIAFIPAGTDHSYGDEGMKTQMALVKTTDKLPITRTPEDANIPLSDAEELLEFLIKDTPADEVPTPVGTASAKSVNIISLFHLEFASNNSEDDADSAKSDPSIIRFLCVERLVLLHENGAFEFVARIPCHEFPWCDHVNIELLGRGMTANELYDSDVGIVILAPHGDDRDPRVVQPFKGFDTLVYEKCTGACGHTQVELEEVGDAEQDAVVHCMGPLHILALVGSMLKDSENEETSDDEKHSSDGSSDDSDDKAGVHGMGPFRSVPCLFCRKTALNPKLVGERTSESVVRYGTHSYGYRCARCQRISWITGAQPVGVEEAATRDDSEGELTAATRAAGMVVADGLPLLARFFGF
ncbi:uncharacterized protein B0T15DRAFT_514645 [Chaetomium strumarium]|uniref:Uncharacterized protein n=1 Tax=Chaetomium strumarium TaxID=1170767 RepID=A0AAJ0GME3_9PEZI|nr:hypothetical protein B0T15DRAFT_514645 [Chaetomium strumarium]